MRQAEMIACLIFFRRKTKRPAGKGGPAGRKEVTPPVGVGGSYEEKASAFDPLYIYRRKKDPKRYTFFGKF